MNSKNIIYLSRSFVVTLLIIASFSCQKSNEMNRLDVLSAMHSETIEDDLESAGENIFQLGHGCKHATLAQIAYVDLGVSKLNQFLQKCYYKTATEINNIF